FRPVPRRSLLTLMTSTLFLFSSSLSFLLFYCSRAPRALHSFPTRRSSDLVDGSFGGVQLFNKLVKTLGISAMQDESAGLGAERLSNGLTQSTGSSGDKYRTVSILHGNS